VTSPNAVHRRPGNRELVKTPQIVSNHAWAEVVGLSEVEDLAHDLPGGCSGRSVRCSGPIAEAGFTELGVAPFPFVEYPPGNPEVSAGSGHVSGGRGRLLQHLQPPAADSPLLCLRHGVLHSKVFGLRTES
jgi:hypothetical protein